MVLVRQFQLKSVCWGFQDTIKKLNMYCDPQWYFHGEFEEKFGFEVVDKLQQLKKWPTAIVAQDDIAIGIIRALDQIGTSVPEDISIVGFDDIEISRHYNLTTVRQNKYEMGGFTAFVENNQR